MCSLQLIDKESECLLQSSVQTLQKVRKPFKGHTMIVSHCIMPDNTMWVSEELLSAMFCGSCH